MTSRARTKPWSIAAWALPLFIVVGVAGCGGSDNNASTQTQSTGTTAPTTTGSSTTGSGSSSHKKSAKQGSSTTKKKAQQPEQGTQTTRTIPSPAQSLPRKLAGTGVQKIRIQDGLPVGGQPRLIYRNGRRVRLAVSSNRSARLSILKLGIAKRIPAHGTAQVAFPANKVGLYSVDILNANGSRSRVAVLEIR